MIKKGIHILIICVLTFSALSAQQNKVTEFEQAQALFESGKYQQAQKLLSKIVAKQPDFAEAYFYLGRTYIRLNKMSDAVDSFEKTVSLCDTSAKYHLIYGNALFMLAGQGSKFKLFGRIKKGRRELDRAIELDPENLPARYALIQFYSQAPGIMGGDKNKAKQYMDEMIQIDSLNILAIAAKSQQLIYDKNLAQARLQLKQAVQSCKTSQDSLQIGTMFNLLGYAYLKEENCPQAIDSFNMYITLAPKEPNAHDSLGEAYYKCGDLDAAIAEYEKALSMNPEFKNSQKMLKKIKKEKASK